MMTCSFRVRVGETYFAKDLPSTRALKVLTFQGKDAHWLVPFLRITANGRTAIDHHAWRSIIIFLLDFGRIHFAIQSTANTEWIEFTVSQFTVVDLSGLSRRE